MKYRVLLNPAAESSSAGGGGAGKDLGAIMDRVQSAVDGTQQSQQKPADQLQHDQVTTTPVGKDKQIVIPGEEKRGTDNVIGDPNADLDVGEFGDDTIEIEKPAGDDKSQQQQSQQKTPDQVEAERVAAESEAARKVTEQQQTQQQPPKPGEVDVSKLEPHPDHAKYSRDYSMFTDENDAAIIRAAPNHVYNYFRNRLPAVMQEVEKYKAQYQEVLKANGIPPNYFEHQDSYKLTTAYRAKEAAFSDVEYQEAHWASELEKIRGGAKVLKNLIGFDAKGQPQFSDVVVTEENSGKLMDDINKVLGTLGGKKQQIAQEAAVMSQKFEERRGNLAKIIAEGEKKYFPFYEPGDKNYTPEVAKNIAGFIKTLPPELQDSVLARPLAKAYLLMHETTAYIREMKKSSSATAQSNVAGQQRTNVQQKQTDDTQVLNRGGGGGGRGEEVYTIKEFEDGEPAV